MRLLRYDWERGTALGLRDGDDVFLSLRRARVFAASAQRSRQAQFQPAATKSIPAAKSTHKSSHCTASPSRVSSCRVTIERAF